jgi:Malectin domain/IPT/TIG domain
MKQAVTLVTFYVFSILACFTNGEILQHSKDLEPSSILGHFVETEKISLQHNCSNNITEYGKAENATSPIVNAMNNNGTNELQYRSINRELQASVPVTLPFRINCGNLTGDYTDLSTGKKWVQDRYFQGSYTVWNGCPEAARRGINIPTHLCQTRNSQSYTYNIPVPFTGNYKLTLYFVETFFTAAGKRVFSVSAEGSNIITNLDTFVTGGGIMKPVIRTFTVNVQDGFLTIGGISSVNQASISAIEIENMSPTAPTPVTAPTNLPPSNGFQDIRINCGFDRSYTDSVAKVWVADKFFTGGQSVSVSNAIANTVDDSLYQSERAGDTFRYEIPVPIGSYDIILFFSENEFTATKQRLFDVTVEGQLKTNVDIFQMAGGAFRATRLQFFRIVEDGSLTIQFRKSAQFPTAGIPKLGAIQVLLDKPHVAHAVATGPYVGTVTDPIFNKANVRLVGQTSHTHGDGLTLNSFNWKEGNTALGTNVNTNYAFSVGLHTVSLTVKDTGGNENTEVTTVNIRAFGFPAITSLVPNSGNPSGQYNVQIRGSGFNYTANQITVRFGNTVLTGSAISIINPTTIQVVAPASAVSISVGVTVQTPLGTSTASSFNYIGSIPIAWQEGKILDYLQPTVGRFGPDKRLYIGTRKGRLLKVTMNEDFTAPLNTIVAFVNPDHEDAM